MHARTTLALTALSAALVTVLSAGTASAQVQESTRIRYGVALEGGGLFAPGVVDLGFVGVQGQLGVQIDDLLGVYAAPHIDVLGGPTGSGVQLGGALLVDFTLAHIFTVGVGPELAGFAALGGAGLSGGILFGARLHLAVNPLVVLSRHGLRRKALTLGLDLPLFAGGGAGALSTTRAATDELVASPTFTIGYQAF